MIHQIIKLFSRLHIVIASLFFMAACTESDDVDTSLSMEKIIFSQDTIKFDTVFADVPSVTKSLWVYNRSKKDIVIRNVRLENGNQMGFRVNIDGTFLNDSKGFQVLDYKLRKNDSIRVFVEVTAPDIKDINPKLVEDNLLFLTDDEKFKKINLRAYSWKAKKWKDKYIVNDTVITSDNPYVIYGNLVIAPNAKLTIEEGTHLFFHSDSECKVYGTLVVNGTSHKNVVFRGDRLDRIFSQLPYDRLSGQWKGIRFFSSAKNNIFQYADIHGAFNGVTVDSTSIKSPCLEMYASTVHNCQGYGVIARHANIKLENCQITNAMQDCVYIQGGNTFINACTLAQFYPFDSNRGVALNVESKKGIDIKGFKCLNTIITGYGTNQLLLNISNEEIGNKCVFANCILLSDKIGEKSEKYFCDIFWENNDKNEWIPEKEFILIDNEKFEYNFRLAVNSNAIGKANPKTIPMLDRLGNKRDNNPDIGAYEYVNNVEESKK